MCLAFLEYYPKRDQMTEACYSGVDAEKLAKLLGAQKMNRMDDEKTTVINAKGQNQTFKNFVKDVDWGANDSKRRFGLVQDLDKFGRDDPHGVICLIFAKNKNDPKVISLEI